MRTPPPHVAARPEHTLPRALLQRSDPKWQPDDSRDKCAFCNKEFTWLLRRHHCRCSKSRAALEFSCDGLCASGFAARSCATSALPSARKRTVTTTCGAATHASRLEDLEVRAARLHTRGSLRCCSRICFCFGCCTASSSPSCRPPHAFVYSIPDGNAADALCLVPAFIQLIDDYINE